MAKHAKLAYVLCAGRGERLRPLTDVIPKPILPLGHQPMVFHLLDRLKAAGVRKFIINLHHQPALLRHSLGFWAKYNHIQMMFLDEPVLLGTGGAIANAMHLLTEPFWVVNADFLPHGFSFFEMEKAQRAPAALALRPMAAGEPYNPVGVTGDRIVRVSGCFGEGDSVASDSVASGKDHQFVGVQRIEPDALEHLDRSKPVFGIFEGLYRHLHDAGLPIQAHICRELWSMDPGTPRGYLDANLRLLMESADNVYLGPGATVPASSRAQSSLIGMGSKIGENTLIKDSLVFPNVRIADGVELRQSIVATDIDHNLTGKIWINGKTAEI